jgi:hypothetical protein
MTEEDLDQLERRMYAGERPTEELRALAAQIDQTLDAELTEKLSDIWNLVLHRKLLPTLETAKAIVRTSEVGDSSYPISTNDGLIYDDLSTAERAELIDFIMARVSNNSAPAARQSLIEFADELAGGGPKV